MTSSDPTGNANHRSGYVALIGQPNVGKSTLVNRLVGRKLSIVTRKPQTTRNRVLAILSAPAYQMILLDTPGILEPKYKLHESMMGAVQYAVEDADLLLYMIDARSADPDDLGLSFIKDRPAFLLLNKIDLIDSSEALPLAAAYLEKYPFKEVIPISALKGTKVDLLPELILPFLPAGPPFYPKDMVSEHPERFFVAEIIREKIFQLYQAEIPYSTQVNIVQFIEKEGEKDHIDAEIVVERASQKGILIGKKGAALKKVGIRARKDIEAFLQKPVYLKLHVKVRDGWRNKESFLRQYGYEK